MLCVCARTRACVQYPGLICTTRHNIIFLSATLQPLSGAYHHNEYDRYSQTSQTSVKPIPTCPTPTARPPANTLHL